MPKVSVIVPVCNVDKYLTLCLESILAQALTDIEIICVDDGSTDQSATILDDFAQRDGRIRVIHQENQGYGKSMNVGMKMATGEYIGIVESDDWIAPEFYQKLYTVATKQNLDVIKSDAYFAWEKIGYNYCVHSQALEEYYDRVLTKKERTIQFRFLMNTWTGIYKRSFLEEHDIWHNESPGASYQDNGFWFQTLYFAKRVMWLNEAFYYYRQDNPGASVKDIRKVMAMTKEYDYIEELLRKKNVGKTAFELCGYYRLMRNRGTFYRIADECKKDFCKQLIIDYKEYGDCIEDSAYLKQWYECLCRDTDVFCFNVVKNKERVLEQINKVQRIYIYGAGVRGQRLFRSLCYMGYYDKIECFIESDTPKKDVVCGKKVEKISDVLDDDNENLYIISVKKGTDAYQQMCLCLDYFDIPHRMDSEDIFDNFYSLSG